MNKTKEIEESGVLSIIKELREESSTNGKLAILEKYKEIELFKRTLYLAYNNLLVYGMKKLPEPEYHDNSLSLAHVYDQMLPLFYNRDITGGDAKEYLKSIFQSLYKEDYEVLKLVFGRDVKAGINTKSINKVLGSSFIPKVPYMGAKPYSKKIVDKLFEKANYKVYADIKMDGRYANIQVHKDAVIIESRQGKPNYFGNVFNHLTENKHKDIKTPFVLNGELIIKDTTRYLSNGIISALVSIGDKILAGKVVDKEKAKLQKEYGKSYEELLERITFVCWDIISYEEYTANYSSTPRFKRLRNLKQVNMEPKNIEIVEHKLVHKIEEARTYLVEVLERGEEGLVLKSFNGVWESKKPNYQVKMKLEMTVDLEIIGFKEGKKGTRFEGSLGSLIGRSSCGRVQTDPAGLTDQQREEIWNNKEKFERTIMEVKCNGLSRNSEGSYALLHPSVNKFRDDKDVADSLEDIQKIVAGADLL